MSLRLNLQDLDICAPTSMEDATCTSVRCREEYISRCLDVHRQATGSKGGSLIVACKVFDSACELFSGTHAALEELRVKCAPFVLIAELDDPESRFRAFKESSGTRISWEVAVTCFREALCELMPQDGQHKVFCSDLRAVWFVKHAVACKKACIVFYPIMTLFGACLSTSAMACHK